MNIKKVVRFIFGLGSQSSGYMDSSLYIPTSFLGDKLLFNSELELCKLEVNYGGFYKSAVTLYMQFLQQTNSGRFNNPTGVREPNTQLLREFFEDPANQLTAKAPLNVVVDSAEWDDCFSYTVMITYEFPYKTFNWPACLSTVKKLLLRYIELAELPKNLLTDLQVVEESSILVRDGEKGDWIPVANIVREQCGLVPLASEAKA